MHTRMTFGEQQAAKKNKKDMMSGITMTLLCVAMAIPLFMLIARELGK